MGTSQSHMRINDGVESASATMTKPKKKIAGHHVATLGTEKHGASHDNRRKRTPRFLMKLPRRSTASLSLSENDSLEHPAQHDFDLSDELLCSTIPETTTLVDPSMEHGQDMIGLIRSSVIGNRCVFTSPFGDREIVYADYTASARMLSFLEDYMVKVIAPLYANTHTEASLTGAQTTHLREEARDFIHKSVNAPKDDYAVLFCGTGSTGAIDKLVRVLGFSIPEYAEKKWNLKSYIPENQRPVVFISHFEHHSNELIWRESTARVVVVEEDENGLPNLQHLEKELLHYKKQQVPLIGSFSAGSNVTGIKSDTRAIARVLHKHGALAFFDYAGVGAYVDIDMRGNGDEDCMDAVFLSPHKFVGGPGAAGVLVAKRTLFAGPFGIPTSTPSLPAGGTVAFVSQYNHAYIRNVEIREDGGTPGIPQCIRAGLVFWIKDQVGSKLIEQCEAHHTVRALEAWSKHPRIALLGAERPACCDPKKRVPIFSFNIISPVDASSRRFSGRDYAKCVKPPFDHTVARQVLPMGNAGMIANAYQDMYSDRFMLPLHQNFVIALLNDLYGIQGRGGCSCAGPYGHILFGVDGEDGKPVSAKLQQLAVEGYEAYKPGWARINLNYFCPQEEVEFILEAVRQIASFGWKLLPFYTQDVKSGKFTHLSLHRKQGGEKPRFSLNDMVLKPSQDPNNFTTAQIQYPVPTCLEGERSHQDFAKILDTALALYDQAEQDIANHDDYQDFATSLPKNADPGNVWWLRPSEATKKLQHVASRRGSKRISRRKLCSLTQ